MATNIDEIFYGVVKVYYPLKGFGFITRPKGRDLFFYRTAFADETHILEGNAVQFRIEKGDSGLRAIQIKRTG
jgi:CspA family cold shock protein